MGESLAGGWDNTSQNCGVRDLGKWVGLKGTPSHPEYVAEWGGMLDVAGAPDNAELEDMIQSGIIMHSFVSAFFHPILCL